MWKLRGHSSTHWLGLKLGGRGGWLAPLNHLWLCFHDSICTLFWSRRHTKLVNERETCVLMNGKGMCRFLCCPLAPAPPQLLSILRKECSHNLSSARETPTWGVTVTSTVSQRSNLETVRRGNDLPLSPWRIFCVLQFCYRRCRIHCAV